MKELYHGTIHDIMEINLNERKGYKDFGKGFYATAIKSHADKIAKRNKYRTELREKSISRKNPNYKAKSFQAFRYNLEFDDSCINHPENLKIKIFLQADTEWMKFILLNRESEVTQHDYDIVIGPTADENTVTIINSYREELIATNYAEEVLEQVISELKPENLPKQYFFGTQKAIKKLRFKKIRREIVG